MLTDPIADMFARIKNAGMASRDELTVPASKLKHEIAKLFEREGYVKSVHRVEQDPQDVLKIELRRVNGKLAFRDIRRVSSPGRRHYVRASEIPYVMNGLGMAVISTSQGLMTDKEARKAGLGGELITKIW